jgi:hypothetical protein
VRRRAVAVPLVVGLVGIALGLVELAIDSAHALLAYVAAYLTALTIAVGALLFLMIADTARARWFLVFRRLTGALAATMPLFLLLFVPIALGVKRLYPWAQAPGTLTGESQAWATHAQPWLNVPFFLARGFGYLLTWSAFALLLRRDNIANDEQPSESRVRRQRFVSAVGIPVMAITLTLASFDWVMSLNTRWASDILGVYLFAGAFAGAIGATAFAAWLAWRARLLPPEVGSPHFHALGRVLLVAVIFWAYTAFAQFLLVWIADMPRESSFYADRVRGGWAYVAALLFFANFAIPFALLLSRSLKRAPAMLAAVGAWVVCTHALDVYWLIVPALHGGLRWLDVAMIVGVVGVVAAFGSWRFFAARSVPIHDPAFAEALRYESP